MLHQTPFHEVTTQAGAQFRAEAQWLLPASFDNVRQEYQRACTKPVLFEMSHCGKIELTGRDAGRFLHNLCTNDVVGIACGEGREAYLTTNQAKIIAHILIYPHQSAEKGRIISLDSGPGMGEAVAKYLQRYLISEQAEIADRTM